MFHLEVGSHFDMAHRLFGYEGKCRKTHGHGVKVKVGIKGDELDDLGMLIDFSIVKKVLKERLEEFDHKLILNKWDERGSKELWEDEVIYLHGNPTAENLSQSLYTQLCNCLNCKEYRVEYVKVYESPDCCITYRSE